MRDIMNIGLHLHMSTVLNAHLLVIDGKVYKDRSGKYGGVGAMVGTMIVPEDKEIGDVKVERLEAGTIMTYDNESGKIVLISTQPITFTQIK